MTPSGHQARVQQIQQSQEDADREAAQKADEAGRQARILAGQSAIDKAFGQFNDDYYGKYKKDYTDYYSPQVNQQYDQAKTDLSYRLAGQGLTQSSIAAKLYGDLQRKYDDTNLQISNQAQDAARTLQGNVEKEKTDLYSLNNSSADPNAISNRASGSATALVAPTAYAPLGNVFASALGTFANYAAADQKSLNPQLSSSTLFGAGSNKGSGTVVG